MAAIASGVGMPCGEMALTRTPERATSAATERTMPRTAALEALYAGGATLPRTAAVLAVQMLLPRASRRRPGR